MMTGSLPEIEADITHVIADVYRSLYQKNHACANCYREMLLQILTDPMSPVWEIDGATDNNERIVCMHEFGKSVTPYELMDLMNSGAPLELIAKYLRDDGHEKSNRVR